MMLLFRTSFYLDFFSNCDLQKLFEMITACKETVNSSLVTSGNNNLNEKEMSGPANLERNIVCHQVRNTLPCSFCFVVCNIFEIPLKNSLRYSSGKVGLSNNTLKTHLKKSGLLFLPVKGTSNIWGPNEEKIY